MRDEGSEYLKRYPDLLRWMNQCIACGSRGYRPDLPENIRPYPSHGARTLRQHYQPLPVDDVGLCEQCRAALDALGRGR
jgi:hypothetical protein